MSDQLELEAKRGELLGLSAIINQEDFHWNLVDNPNPIPFREDAVEKTARWCMRSRGFSPFAERAVLEALQRLAVWDEP